MPRRLARTAVAGIALGLAGCNLAPAYHSPRLAPAPAAFKEAPGWRAAAPADAAAKGSWWVLFEDPVLSGLEERVEVTNQTVAQYRAAYAAARAVVRQERAALLPSLTVQGSATESGNRTSSGISTTSHAAEVQLGASWAPDLWGRLGNTAREGGYNASAAAADFNNATLSARTELAVDYLTLRGIDAQIDLLDQTIAAYLRSMQVTQNKYAAGTVARSDVFQAQTALNNARADRRDLDRQRALMEHAIAVLVGENPSTFGLAKVDWRPVVPEVPAVLPSDMVERRPDIAAAERRVAAANANIGIQRSAYFPQVSLSAGTGLSGTSIGDLFSAPATLWSLGLSALGTLFDFGATNAKVAQARAQFDQAAALYRQTALTAFQQVEDNLAAVAVYRDVALQRDQAGAAADKAETIAQNQYRVGLTDYTTVATAQAAAYSTRLSRVAATVNQQTSAVKLIEAIGGQWQDAPSPVTPPEVGK